MAHHIQDIHLAEFLLDPGKRDYSAQRLQETYHTNNLFTIWEKQRKALAEKDLEDAYYNIELPLSKVIAHMENHGVLLDTAFLGTLSKHMHEQVKRIEQEIYELSGEEFNISSPKQLGVILFEKLGLPPVKKTKTGYSTNAAVLQELAMKHPLPEKIMEYRQYTKLLSTYVDAFPGLVDHSNRLHTTYTQTIASTGRLSSINPNLQNIPIRTDVGREIRKAFIAEEGSYLIALDYSQIELRLLAHFSEDKTLLEAFADNKDIHSHTASLIFQKELEKVTPEERRMAKTVNFGIVYGMGPFKLSRDMKISLAEAKQFISEYFLTYPGVRRYLDGTEEEAKSQGFLRTLSGRLRYFPELHSRNRVAYEAGKREAINYPLQGSAADIIKLAMLKLHEHIEQSGLRTKMILQVHDELVLEAPEAEVEQITKEAKDIMEHVVELQVPLIVDVGVGKNWHEAH